MARYRPTWRVDLVDGVNHTEQKFDSEHQARKQFDFLVAAWTQNASDIPSNRIERSASDFQIISNLSGSALISIEVYYA